MTKPTDELREKIALVVLKTLDTSWLTAAMQRDKAFRVADDILATLPAQPDVSGLVEALERIVSIKPVEEDPGDEYGFSNCQTMGHNEGVAECQDIARQALTLSATPESGWREDMENAPKDGTHILISNGNDDQPDVVFWDAAYASGGYYQNSATAWLNSGGEQIDAEPTHWMPLPDAPNTEGSE